MGVTETNTSSMTTGDDSSQHGNKVIGRMRESAAAQLSTQKSKATEGLGSVAKAVRQSTQQLRDQQHDTLAGYVESAADQIERFSERVREKDVTELLDDAQRLARRQPAVFIGSAFMVGLLGVRFLKSSTRGGRDEARGQERLSQYGGSEYRGGTVTPYSSRPQAQSTGYSGGTTERGSGGASSPRTGTGTGGYAAGASGTETAGRTGSTTSSAATDAADERGAGTTGRKAGSPAGGNRTSTSRGNKEKQ